MRKTGLLMVLLAAGCLAYVSQARHMKGAHGRDETAGRRSMFPANKNEALRETSVRKFGLNDVKKVIDVVTTVGKVAEKIGSVFLPVLLRRDGLPGREKSPHEVWESLGTVADTMDQLSMRVEHLLAAADSEDLQTLGRDFADAVQRLDDLRPDVRLQFDADERIVVNAAAEQWAEDVLAEGAGGVLGLLGGLHELVVGDVVREYWAQVLDPQGRDEGPELEQLVEGVLDMERLGYTYWILALAIDNQAPEIEALRGTSVLKFGLKDVKKIIDVVTTVGKVAEEIGSVFLPVLHRRDGLPGREKSPHEAFRGTSVRKFGLEDVKKVIDVVTTVGKVAEEIGSLFLPVLHRRDGLPEREKSSHEALLETSARKFSLKDVKKVIDVVTTVGKVAEKIGSVFLPVLHRRDGLPGREKSPHEVWESLGPVADTMDQLSKRVEHLLAAADSEDLQTLGRDFADAVQRLDDLLMTERLVAQSSHLVTDPLVLAENMREL